MKLHLLSDLHLEFSPMELPGGDILLLAGDILVADCLREERTDRTATQHKKEAEDFFRNQCTKYNKVYYILGNHEHYGSELIDTAKIIRNYFTENNYPVTLLENEIVELNDGYMLYGATFWTDYNRYNPIAMSVAENSMNDHRRIRHLEKPVRAEKLWLINTECRNSLKGYVEKHKDKKFIVMTHHCPDLRSCHPKFGSDVINYSYCNVGLSGFILDNPQITHWFHGHTHDSHNYMIGDCNVVCNPRGYAKSFRPEDSQNNAFNINITMEI